MSSERFSYQIKVPPTAIDQQDHVNNLKYLEWCLDAAQRHWESKARPEMLREYIWYVLHHSIDYRAAAFEGDLLEIETWVTESKGVRSERRYRIVRQSDQREIIRAKTVWCLLRADTQKPVKIPDELRKLF